MKIIFEYDSAEEKASFETLLVKEGQTLEQIEDVFKREVEDRIHTALLHTGLKALKDRSVFKEAVSKIALSVVEDRKLQREKNIEKINEKRAAAGIEPVRK